MLLLTTLSALAVLASKPKTIPVAKSNWVTIGRAVNGMALQADMATLQSSGRQRAVWLRASSPAAKSGGVRTSTFLVWLDCETRMFNLMISRDDDASGKALAQRSFGDAGKGFERPKAGSAAAGAIRTFCK